MRKMTRLENSSPGTQREANSGYFSNCGEPDGKGDAPGVAPWGKELTELCREIAGAFLRGYADGKRGGRIRAKITSGICERTGCVPAQAESLVDLSLELIHHAAYGTFRRSRLEIDILMTRASGRLDDFQHN